MPALLSGVTPARMCTRLCSPRLRTSFIQVANFSRLKTHCVWMNFAPLSIFFSRRAARYSKGSANGFSAAPAKICGGASITNSSPMKRPFSVMSVTVRSSCIESMSKTFLPWAWLPNFWWSPLRQSMLRSPSAEAPSRSLCSAIRLRSRQTIWKTGSTPTDFRIAAAAMLLMRTIAVWLSVTLTASTNFFSSSPLRMTTSASALRGGPHSAVTAKAPASRTRWRLLFMAFTGCCPPGSVFSGRRGARCSSSWGGRAP